MKNKMLKEINNLIEKYCEAVIDLEDTYEIDYKQEKEQWLDQLPDTEVSFNQAMLQIHTSVEFVEELTKIKNILEENDRKKH